MADKKISELTSLDGTTVAAGDLLPIVDVSGAETKKITLGDVLSISDPAYAVVVQADIGTAPNEVPLNQYLGTMAYENTAMVSVPASASAAGDVGQIAQDGSYLYVCTAQDTWKRVAIATW